MLDTEKLVKVLQDGKVEFVVVGGLAMVTYGSAHVTEDIDICYSRTTTNLAALAAALAPTHPYPPGRVDCFEKSRRTSERPPAPSGT